MFSSAICNLADSYKYSHYNLLPDTVRNTHFYFEARNDKQFQKVIPFGLQYLIKLYLDHDMLFDSDLVNTQILCTKHGIPFDMEGWKYILNLGYFPVKIIGKPEGLISDIREPLFTVESTDPRCAWLPGFLETLLVKMWYPSTIATKAYYMRQMLEGYLEGNTDNKAWVDFAYHNFGDRGSTSVEAAALAGAAHLISFKGTDNFNALELINIYYSDVENSYQQVGFSIPATEHSVMTSYTQQYEHIAIEKFVTTYAGNNKLVACVLDTYDIDAAVYYVTSVGSNVRGWIENTGSTLVMRPDSGEPIEVLERIIKIMLANDVKFDVNNYGLKLFKNYRLIWGDGITPTQIDKILAWLIDGGFSPENMAFGSGGDLVQNCNRDTLGFAYKLSAVESYKNLDVSGDTEWIGVNKAPKTDPGKHSKAGRQTIKQGRIYYENGVMTPGYNFKEVRRNAGIIC